MPRGATRSASKNTKVAEDKNEYVLPPRRAKTPVK